MRLTLSAPRNALRNALAYAPGLALVVTLLGIPQFLGAQAAQAIRGRVTSDSGAGVPAADIIVVVAPSAESITGKSDATGAYRVPIPRGTATGEYLVYVTAPGRVSARQRVTFAPGDTDAVVNVKLAAAVTTVAPILVREERGRPERSLGTESGPPVSDGLNKQVDGVVNALPPELQGNFAAMAALVPGLSVTSNGASAFGLGPDANLTTLNGIPFSAASIPRDLATTTTYLTSPWDPTRGGFSGALASASVDAGTNITNRRTRVTLDTPPMQGGDAAAARFGQVYTNLQLGHAGSGAFVYDKYFYNYGIQASRRVASVSSLQDLDAEALARAGVARDSALRLIQILNAHGIPLTIDGIPSQRTRTSAQFLGRFDRSLPRGAPGATPEPEWHVLAGGDYVKAEASSLAPTVSPATTGTTTNSGALVQGLYSRYFGTFGDYINETASALSYRTAGGSPYLALPGASVLIASAPAGAAPTLGSVSFGGTGAVAGSARTWSWDITNQTDFLVNHRSELPAKFYVQSRYERYNQSRPANGLGSFTFGSLEDLAQNAPSTFSRVLNAPALSGGQWTGASALGGSWSTTRLTLAGGLRVDANVFTGAPAPNGLIASTFGVRNDRLPNSVALSPRVGFNWYPTAEKGPALYFSPISSTYRAGYQIRGGIGQFRSFLPSPLLADAIGATGLRNSGRELLCTGPGAPTPDWQGYATDPSRIPTTCVGGPTVFADTAPTVTLIDPSFEPSRAWRATVGWTNTIHNNFLAIDAVYSLNLNQPGTIDLNFAGIPRDSLPDEDRRPVFVPVSSIVPWTGRSSAVESRRSSSFGPVLERVSDLRGATRQITVYAIPNLPFRFGLLTLGYTYSDARSQARGFDASAAGDPRTSEWSPAFTPRHQFVFQGAKWFRGGKVALTFAGRVMSGVRYTPIVEGDVNGDGTPGDRAFVFDPSRVADSSLAVGLRDLLSGGPSSAQRCLNRQLNALAGRNSCVGPWTATANASIVLAGVPGTSGRGQASLNLFNPLGALDRLLHGGQRVHGWGTEPFIDETLYRVRGFDSVARRFIYQVNPRFGSSRPATNPFYSPFRITLDVRFDLGPTRDAQRLELNLRVSPPLAGTRAPADSIKQRYISGSFDGIYRSLLRMGDSLALSRAQAEQMQTRDKFLRARIDSVYGVLAAYLAALPSSYDTREALQHVADANAAAWNAIYAEAPFLTQLLTPGQVRRLPPPLVAMLTVPNFNSRFFF